MPRGIKTLALLLALAFAGSAKAVTSSCSLTTTALGCYMAISGQAGVVLQLSGTWTGTVRLVANAGGTEFVPITVTSLGDSRKVFNITANGIYRADVLGSIVVSVLPDSVSSGTINAFVRTLSSGETDTILSSLNATVFQGDSPWITQNQGGNISVTASALPANAAQETGGNLASLAAEDFATQTTLAALNAKIPSQGQATKASSVPVVLPSDGQTLGVSVTSGVAGISVTAAVASGVAGISVTANVTGGVAGISVTATIAGGGAGVAVSVTSGVAGISTTANVTQLGSNNIDLGAGNIGSGTQRVVDATNSPARAVSVTAGVAGISVTAQVTGGVAGISVTANLTGINGVAPSVGAGNIDTGTQRVVDATNSPGRAVSVTAGVAGISVTAQITGGAAGISVTGGTLTKGTQGSTGFSTQDLKDAGRVNLVFWAVAVAAGTTGTETAITLNRRPDTGAGSSAASFVVTSGKRFRITSITFATRGNATATIQTTTFNFRVNTAGAVTTGSTPIVIGARSATPATASAWDRLTVPIPDGFELLGDGTMQFGITAAATYTTNAPTWDVLITGFEY